MIRHLECFTFAAIRHLHHAVRWSLRKLCSGDDRPGCGNGRSGCCDSRSSSGDSRSSSGDGRSSSGDGRSGCGDGRSGCGDGGCCSCDSGSGGSDDGLCCCDNRGLGSGDGGLGSGDWFSWSSGAIRARPCLCEETYGSEVSARRKRDAHNTGSKKLAA